MKYASNGKKYPTTYTSVAEVPWTSVAIAPPTSAATSWVQETPSKCETSALSRPSKYSPTAYTSDPLEPHTPRYKGSSNGGSSIWIQLEPL
jgi:hypothetical protein